MRRQENKRSLHSL